MNYYPMWGPPPHSNGGNMNYRQIERIAEKAVRRALQIKDSDKNNKRKRKEEKRKRFQQAKATLFFAIEWFALGIIFSPIISSIGRIILKRLTE